MEVVSQRLQQINQAINEIMRSRPGIRLSEEDFQGEFLELAQSINRLAIMLDELREYALRISEGELDTESPTRHNYLAAGVKSIHFKLKHIIWQVQQVSDGDYGQTLEFMGEFSSVFNAMNEQIRTQKEKLVLQRNTMINTFDHIDSMILVSDPITGELMFVNMRANEELRLNSVKRLQTVIDEIVSYRELEKHERDIYDTGSRLWFRITSTPIEWFDGDAVILHSCRDITKEKRHEAQLVHLATVDELTGTLNRRAGIQELQQEIDDLADGEKMSICFIDINDLKGINDNYGHAEGDFVIKLVAEALMDGVRKGDIVARFGGDEFIAVFAKIDSDVATKVIKRIVEKVEQQSVDSDRPYNISFCYGMIDVCGPTDLRVEEIIEQADKLMYEAKAMRKSCRINIPSKPNVS